MKKEFPNWQPSYEDNIGIISSTYHSIKEELNILQNHIKCPDDFVYQFIGEIQKEWCSDSCFSKARKYKKNP